MWITLARLLTKGKPSQTSWAWDFKDLNHLKSDATEDQSNYTTAAEQWYEQFPLSEAAQTNNRLQSKLQSDSTLNNNVSDLPSLNPISVSSTSELE